MNRFARMTALVLTGGALLVSPPAPAQQKPAAKPRALTTKTADFKGDFDGMLARRSIRVLIPYSRTLYFNDKGRERGVTADLFRQFERWVNEKYKKDLGKRPLTVFIRPTTRDHLLTDVAAGKGDIGAGNISVTEERRKISGFYVAPNQAGMSELVLTGPKSPVVNTVDDLSGQTVHVRQSSSYHEDLVALNERFKKDGKPLAKLVLMPEALEDEDMMEMLNVGLLSVIVVDDWKAKMWAQVWKGVKVNEGAVLHSGDVTGWAIRKDSPKLEALLDEFYTKWVAKQGHQSDRSWNYNKKVKQLRDPSGSEDYKRFQGTLELFKKYGDKYGFDPLMLAAQGYQESQLNQEAKSQVGAIGVMQVMPATGAELKVGDIKVTEPNIHAGTKYMDQLMTKYFPDAKFNENNRSLFAFASYNCGPGNVSRMRKEAVKKGLDPDKWFNNVEIVTAAKIGTETTTYVRNIFKYYVAYRLMIDVEEEKKRALEGIEKGPLVTIEKKS